MSKISYFIVRTFDVKHHAAHGTILINFGPEKGSYNPPPPTGCLKTQAVPIPLAKKCAPPLKENPGSVPDMEDLMHDL